MVLAYCCCSWLVLIKPRLSADSCQARAGFGSFGAVGFSYGGEPAVTAAEAGSDVSDDSEEESDEEDGDGRVTVDAEVGKQYSRAPNAHPPNKPRSGALH